MRLKEAGTTVERIVRRIAWGVIALFLIALFGTFIVPLLFSDPARTLRFAREAVVTPGCWIVVLGPVAFWCCLVAIALRVPRNVRSADLGQLGGRRLNVGGLLGILKAYRARHGFDALFYGLLIAGTLSVVLLWAAARSTKEPMTAWLVFMTFLWAIFAAWLVFYSGRK